MKLINPRFLALTAIVIAAATMRLVPHPPNFSPIGAIALFGGACFIDRRMAFAVPLAAMFLSDMLLGLTRYGTAIFPMMPYVYGSFVLTTGMGLWIRKKQFVLRTGVATIASAVLFFVVTNFGVWIQWQLYPKTWDGLVACYVEAIPFFHSTLAGNVVYATALFGGFAIAESCFSSLRREPAVEPLHS